MGSREEDWKTVDKIASGVRRGFDSIVHPARKNSERDVHLAGEVAGLVGLGFEVLLVGIGQDEFENHQAGVDHFNRLTAPIAYIVLVDDVVNTARVEVVNVRS